MTVLAFMQNMWVRDPERVKAMIAKYGDLYRRKAIPMFLFAGCVSGRRLKQVLGEELCRAITWDEVSREISNHPSFVPTPDYDHMRTTIEHVKPDVVVCFGRIASDAIRSVWTGKTIRAPHPAARGPDTIAGLNTAAHAIRHILYGNPL